MSNNWSPYVNNGGTAVAICGKDFALIAADTRCSYGYSILSRNASKTKQLTPKVCLVSSGQRSDIDALQYNMEEVVKKYEQKHKVLPTISALAQRLSNELYSRRFFPYYTFNILAGINENGEGIAYVYDAIGSTEPLKYGTVGTGQHMIAPIIDLYYKNKKDITIENCKVISINAMSAAAERDIYTGDAIEIIVIENNNITITKHELRKD